MVPPSSLITYSAGGGCDDVGTASAAAAEAGSGEWQAAGGKARRRQVPAAGCRLRSRRRGERQAWRTGRPAGRGEREGSEWAWAQRGEEQVLMGGCGTAQGGCGRGRAAVCERARTGAGSRGRRRRGQRRVSKKVPIFVALPTPRKMALSYSVSSNVHNGVRAVSIVCVFPGSTSRAGPYRCVKLPLSRRPTRRRSCYPPDPPTELLQAYFLKKPSYFALWPWFVTL